MSILLVLMCVVPLGTQAKIADFTEGGHLETDFDVNFMAEWWYLNGDARLVASDGEKRDCGFFVVLAHQESPMIVSPDGTQLSQYHPLTFCPILICYPYRQLNAMLLFLGSNLLLLTLLPFSSFQQLISSHHHLGHLIMTD